GLSSNVRPMNPSSFLGRKAKLHLFCERPTGRPDSRRPAFVRRPLPSAQARAPSLLRALPPTFADLPELPVKPTRRNRVRRLNLAEQEHEVLSAGLFRPQIAHRSSIPGVLNVIPEAVY